MSNEAVLVKILPDLISELRAYLSEDEACRLAAQLLGGGEARIEAEQRAGKKEARLASVLQ